MDAEAKRNKDYSSRKDCVNDKEWRDNISSAHQLKARALDEKFLTDVCFAVGLDGVTVHTHKLLLAFASPVFEAMFYGSLREEETVVIPDIQPEGFIGLLRYIYSDDTDFRSFNEALAIQVVADKYAVSSLKDICDRYVHNSPITSRNIWEILNHALKTDEKTRKENCLSFLMENTLSALKVTQFLEASQEIIQYVLLILNEVNVSEATLLESITSWADANATSEKTAKEILKSFLPYIRFGALTPSEFCFFIAKRKDIMTHSDALSILMHINVPCAYGLPEWCSTKCRTVTPYRYITFKQPLHTA